MHMTAPELHGDRIYSLMLKQGPQTKAQLGRKLNLSPSQVESGLRNIREIVASRENNPLTYNPHDYSYDLAATERAATRYLRYRLSIIHRYITNLTSSTLTPAQAKFASPTLALLQHQMGQVQGSIQYAESML